MDVMEFLYVFLSMTFYFWNFEEEFHDDIFLLDPPSEEHKEAQYLGPEDT